MNKKLEGKTAVITGGTEGIGFATAKLFVNEGAYVFITGRRRKELDEAVKAIGSNVTGIQGDVTKLADLDRLYQAVKAKGRIDVVFANAGVAEFAPLGSITEEHFDKLFNINVKGTLFTVQKALPLLNDGGSIILTGSVPVRPIRRLSASNQRTLLQGSCPPSRWDAWAKRTKSPRRRCSWPRMIPVLSRESSFSLMAVGHRFDLTVAGVMEN